MNSKHRKGLISGFCVKRMLISLITIPLMIYLGFGLFAYFFADKIIFQPQQFPFKDDESIIKLTTPYGENLSAKFFKNERAEFTILFSHGNAEDLFDLGSFLKQLNEAGFNVLAYDYRGYGMSEGTPSEQNTYEDIEAAYNYLVNEKNIPPEKIIIHGRSLGGAVSIDLASRKKCGGLIVESSFVSAFRVLTRVKIYPFDKFESIKRVGKVTCPVLFIHGKADTLIPFRHSEILFEAANEPKSFYAFEKAGHNDVSEIGGDEYFKVIQKFSDSLAK